MAEPVHDFARLIYLGGDRLKFDVDVAISRHDQ